MKLIPFLTGAALAGALACDGGVDLMERDVAPGAIGQEQELGGAAAGFRAAGGGFRATTDRHAAEVTADGAIRMTPVRTGMTGAPVELVTAAIARGELELGAAPDAVDLSASGALAIDRGAATELLENRADGLEQSWRFVAEPEGLGDLVVSVAVSGHVRAESSDAGISFRGERGTTVHYSNAVWIDASDTAWSVPVSWDGARIAIQVPEAILVASSYPAVLDPTISAETGVDALLDSGYTGARSFEPAIAWSGSRYLVAWRDDRMGNDSDIYVARIEADGVVVDLRGIQVATAGLTQSEPAVTWTGSEWLVAWTHDGGAIAAATVSAGGAVTQLGDVAATAAIESDPALASDGAGALLVWQADADVRAARFSGGAFAAAFDVAATAAAEALPTVAGAASGDYLVAWQSSDGPGQDIRGQLVDAAGPAGAPFDIANAGGPQTTPAAAFTGGEFLVVWRDRSDIAGAAVATDGTVGAPVAVSATATVESNPTAACDSNSCLVAWQDRRDTVDYTHGIYGRRLGFDLSPLGGEITIGDADRNQLSPAAAAAGSGFVTVWADVRSGIPTATLTPIDAAGLVGEPAGVIVTRSARNVQTGPQVVRSASGQLVVWSDSRNAGDDIMARRYDAVGRRLDAGALVVSGAAFDQTTPSIDFDGANYLVVWADNRNNSRYDVYGARFAPDGTLLDPAGIAITTSAQQQMFPDVASGGGASLAVWQDRSNRTDYDLMGAIITPSGAVSVAEIAICRTAGDQRRAAVAWDPTSGQFLVVWSDTRAAGDENVYAARVATDGSVLDPCGVPLSTRAGAQVKPRIAVAGTQVLVAWDDRGDDLAGDVYGVRIEASAGIAILDPAEIALAAGPGMQLGATVVGLKGGRWALAWVDDRNQATAGTDIYGNTVMADGTLAGADYLISGNTDAETSPAFESEINKSNRAYLVYERTRPDTGVTRSRRRRITY